MAEKETKPRGSYSALTGFNRAVPIILFAVALFIALCFITQNTGAFGKGASNVLLGLFSYGAYAVPLFIAVHAFFYPSDVARKRVLSRSIFSVIALIAISALIYTVKNFGIEPVFTPKQYYFDGIELKSGGFVGSVVAYGLIKIFGTAGIIIIAVAIFALYISYFFPKGTCAPRKIFVAIVSGIAWVFSSVETLIKRSRAKSRAKQEKKKKKLDSKRDAELFNDEFFAVDNGMQELSISELGIKETRSADSIEANPTLHDKVRPKSAVEDDFVKVSKDGESFEPADTDPQRKRRTVNMSYSAEDGLRSKVAEQSAPSGFNDIVIEVDAESLFSKPEKEEAANTSYAGYGLDQSAELVFTKDFDPFDLAINEARANKQSTKVAREPIAESITEYEEPVSKFSAEEIERARRNADFEMKKKAIIEARRQATPVENNGVGEGAAKTVEINVQDSVDMNAESVPHSYSVRIEKHENEDQPVSHELNELKTDITEAAIYSPTVTEEMQTESVTAEYRPESRNAKDVYKRAAAFSSVITDYTASVKEEPKRTEPEAKEMPFRAYTVPSAEPTAYAEVKREEAPRREDPMKIERITLNPEPIQFREEVAEARVPEETVKVANESISTPSDTLIEETENEFLTSETVTESVTVEEAPVSVESNPPTGLSFEFPTQNDNSLFAEDDVDEDEEDEADDGETDDDDDFTVEEIPEDEQNEEVIAMRKMFPILDADLSKPKENNYTYEERDDEVYVTSAPVQEKDEPPFDIDGELEGLVEKVEEEPKKPAKPDYTNYEYPPIDILGYDNSTDSDVTEQEINENADKLIETLMSFRVTASVKGVDRGPRITRYEIVPGAGVKVAQITNLFDDIQLNLAADGIRMEAPIPGKSAIGFEIPNKKPATVRLRELLETEEFVTSKSKTYVCIGKDVAGYPVFGDIAKMPHVLIAGATGMGKSVCINAIMISMLYKAKPDEVKFIMIDPKKVEFTMYNGIPHLLIPVVTDPKQAAGALMWAVEQMEKRYEMIEKLAVRNIEAYNAKVAENPSLGEPMSKIVIVIDELNDLMIQVRDPVENLIMSLAQKSRAAGIHLIIGTQRPSVNVITGVIKANIPSRISCKVMSNTDSRTILDSAGAEKLLDKGDMLFHPVGKPKPIRVQGAFVSDKEVEDIMDYLKNSTDGQYDSEALEEINRAAQKCIKKKDSGSDYDDDDDAGEDNGGYYNDRQFLDAVEIAVNSGKISTSLIQRKLSIGYGKAAKFIDVMESIGIVSEPNGQKPREVLITKDEWIEKLSRVNLD